MKKFVCASVFTLIVVGLTMGADFRGQLYDISKDGKTAKFKKAAGKGKFDDPVDVTIDSKVVVKYGKTKFDKDTKKATTTELDAIEKGLMADEFTAATSEKGTNVVITTADEDDATKPTKAVTKILVIKGGKGKTTN